MHSNSKVCLGSLVDDVNDCDSNMDKVMGDEDCDNEKSGNDYSGSDSD